MTDKERQRCIAYKACFGTDAGRDVLAHLKLTAHVNAPHFDRRPPIDTNLLIYDEARRALVLGIIGRVEKNLDAPAQTTAITEGDTDND